MPNWCEGNIRFRGTKKNIKNFLENELVCTVYHNGEIKEVKPDVEQDEYEMYFYSTGGETRDSFYFRNTKRNFIFSESIQFYWPEAEESEEIVVILDNFNAAWGFNEQGWIEHATKYNIDVRMVGFEQGMQFSETLTVTRDGKAVDDVKHYDDWNWECPFPNMGG